MNTAFVLLVCVAAFTIVAAIFYVGTKLGRALSTSHCGGIGMIREIGELVALRVDCSDVGWATDKGSLLGRGRSLLAKCDMVLEYRFNLRNVLIRQTVFGIEVVLPQAEVTVSHGAVNVVHMQHGTLLGIPLRRLRVFDINRLLDEARRNITAKAHRSDDYLATRAQECARAIIGEYISRFAPTDRIRIMFGTECGNNLVGQSDSLTGGSPPLAQRCIMPPESQTAVEYCGVPAQ